MSDNNQGTATVSQDTSALSGGSASTAAASGPASPTPSASDTSSASSPTSSASASDGGAAVPAAAASPVAEGAKPAEAPAPAAAEGTATEAKPAEAPKNDAAASDKKMDVLGDKGEAKTEPGKEGAKPEGDKAAEGAKPEGEATPLPKYESYTLPEGVSVDETALGEFNKILGGIEIGKLDHAGFQNVGQQLVDMHVKGVNDTITKLNDHYVNLHETQKQTWFDNFKSDPEIGGNRMETTVNTARDAIENYGGTEAQVTEFRQLMKDTGVGNNPALIRLITNMADRINQLTTEADNGNGGSNRMVPGQRPVKTQTKSYQRFYTGNNG